MYTLDAIALEKSLHEYFDAYRVRGEWFDLPTECIQEFPIVANQLDAVMEQVCLPQ
ncbi:MAG: GIY-YIG nuclease family protein [Dolichospermum sp.]